MSFLKMNSFLFLRWWGSSSCQLFPGYLYQDLENFTFKQKSRI